MRSNAANQTDEDPVLAMIGVGRQLWADESGDAFVARMRSEQLDLADGESQHMENQTTIHLESSVWERIVQHQREEFATVTGLPLTYEVEGNGIWFYRNGERINRKLSRSQVATAVGRCPLNSTTEIKDLIDYLDL